MAGIEINPIITSTSDSPEEIQRALEAAGLEVVPSEQAENGEQTPAPDASAAAPATATPSASPASGAPSAQPEGGSGSDPETEQEIQDLRAELTELEQNRHKPRRSRDRKVERLVADNRKLAEEKARLEGRLAELERGRTPQTSASDPAAPAAEPEPAAPAAAAELKRPVMPKLADFGYDTEAWGEAMAKYGEDLDTYNEARLDQVRQETRRETRPQATGEPNETQKAWTATAAKAKERYTDYDQVSESANDLAISPVFGALVTNDTEYGPYMAYFLAKNREIAEQIFTETTLPEAAIPLLKLSNEGKQLTPRQSEELGRYVLEANQKAAEWKGMIKAHLMGELDAEPAPAGSAAAAAPAPERQPTREASRAPAPARPLRAGAAPVAPATDPTTMSASDYNRFMDSEAGQAWRRQHNLH